MLAPRLALILCFGSAAALPSAVAGELLPPERPIAEVVDHYVDAKLAAENIAASPPTEDATLVRRLTLDLAGRIPTPAEARWYAESTDPDKKEKLVDRLMNSSGFVRRQADAFEQMLMSGARGNLEEYLQLAIAENRPWDDIFRDLIVGDESDPRRKGASRFLKSRAQDIDRMTSDVSSVFFGVNVSCAKCHDHPRVDDWKQDHYFGMKSFLDRTVEVGNLVGEREFGAVKFKTTAGEEKQAKFMFLTGRVVDVGGTEEPSNEAKRAEKRLLDEARKNNKPRRPSVSARSKLVEVALAPGDRDFFARSIVNRLWDRFFGSGLVMPLDQMHSANPPSHPDLLSWLARDTIEHQYDMTRLIRGLVMTRVYARDSRWDSADPPDPSLFAVAAIRPLTPLQFGGSLWVATTDPASLPEFNPTQDDHARRADDLANRGRSLASAFARPGEPYQISVSEALLLSNGDRLNELLGEGGDRLVGRLAKIENRDEQVNFAVQTVLSRPADDEERALLGSFLQQRADRPAEGCRELLWALVTGSEFRFNH
jgi:hypothetical protein